MADAPRGGAAAGGARGGFGSRGDRGGDRGRGRGRRGPRRGANKNEEKEWQPVTKLGRLVKAGKIKSMEEIYLHSLPIKEYQIVDWFLPKLKDEVMKVCARVGIEKVGQCGSLEKGWVDIGMQRGRLAWSEGDLEIVGMGADHCPCAIDQTRPETNPCWTAYSFQGHRCHRRLRRPRWSRHQDLQRSRNRHPRRHHHRQALCPAHPTRLLGCQPR